MEKRYSGLKKAVAAVVGLFLAGNAYSQEKINPSDFNRTGDFIFNTEYMHEIKRGEKANLNQEIRGGNVTSIYAIDAIEALKEGIAYLNSKEGAFYGNKEDSIRESQRLLLIGRYNDFINRLKKTANPGKKSLEALSAAVSDGIVDPQEFEGVENGVYAIVKRGKDKGKGYRVFHLVNIVDGRISEQPKEQKGVLENKAKGIPIYEPPIQMPTVETLMKKAAEDAKALADKGYWSLVAGANTDFESWGGIFGARRNIDDTFGVGAGIVADMYRKKTLDEVTPMSAKGVNSKVTKEKSGAGIGPYIEGKVGPAVARLGARYYPKIKEISEAQIMKEYEKVMGDKSIDTDTKKNVWSLFGNLLLSVPLGDKMNFEGGVEFNGKREARGVANLTLRL